jgi:hypothetical protein
MSELVTFDKDYAGEQQFARLAVSSLKAFALRHAGDLAVQDAYSAAVRTLEQLSPVLAAAESRSETETARLIAEQVAREVAQQTAQAAMEHATTWASVGETTPVSAPVPAPVPPASPGEV